MGPARLGSRPADRWRDGSPRRPGTCLLLADDGRLKVCLSDRDQGLVAFLVVPSLLGAAEAADEALRSSATDWRVSRASRPPPSRRRWLSRTSPGGIPASPAGGSPTMGLPRRAGGLRASPP